MESSLLFLSMVIVLILFFGIVSNHISKEENSTSGKQYLSLGLALTLLSTSRFEYALFAPIVFISLLFFMYLRGQKPRWLMLSLIIIPPAIYVIGVMAYNYMLMGHVTTISSALKMSFPQPNIPPRLSFSWFPDEASIGFYTLFFTPLLAIYLYLKREQLVQGTRFFAWLFVVLTIFIGICAHFIAVVLFGKWAIASWYFAGYFIVPILTIPIVTQLIAKMRVLRKTWDISLRIIAIFLIVIHVLSIIMLNGERFWRYEAYDATLWANENLPEDTRIGINDAGIFGYYSINSVVNLDGIVNTFEYQDELRDGKLIDYLCENEINYYAAIRHNINNPYFDDGFEQISINSHYYDVNGGEFAVNVTTEVYRSQLFSEGTNQYYFIIWDIQDNCINSG